MSKPLVDRIPISSSYFITERSIHLRFCRNKICKHGNDKDI
ncbi:hypothetical protein [Peptoniphilus rhinitidis]|mgnify:FL=1|nr:hypothetical protein [Peptoniphilus rhinitidis]MDU1044377.1 hypothetical protein [Peptoniphilus rhinitidis]